MDRVVQDKSEEMVDEKVIWFQKPGIDSANDKALLPASEAVQEHNYFRGKLRWRPVKKGSSEEICNTEDGLKLQIMALATDNDNFDTLRQQAASNIDVATKTHITYENQRTTGRRKFGKSVSKFLKGFADFLSVYSGIVELVKGAGQIYGTVAYETLSIFLVIVVNKVDNDSKITVLLTELRKSFPQLEDWVNIYPTPSIRILVAEVYQQVISFARHTSQYFTHFSTRLWMAIGKPPSLGIDETVAKIHGKLAEVNSEAMIQLHKRSQKIHIVVEDNNVHIKKLETSNMELERLNGVLTRSLERLEVQHEKFVQEVKLKNEEEDRQRLETFKEVLSLTYPCDETDVEVCQKSQERAFSKLPGRARNWRGVEYRQMSPELLENCEPYEQWLDRTESCLLFLGGQTQLEGRNGRGFTHSWLSPATTYVTEELRAQGQKVAHYCCHPGDTAERYEVKDVIATIMYQMLEWKPEILRNKYQQFRAMVQSDAWQAEHEATAVSALFRMLLEVLIEIKDLGTIFIIIDRVDRCGRKLDPVMKELVGLVMEDLGKVKILVVHNSAFDEQWDTDDMEEKALSRVLIRQKWDQTRLTPLELQRALSAH